MSSTTLSRAVLAADALNPSDRLVLLKCLVDRLADESNIPEVTPTIRSKQTLDFVLDRIIRARPSNKKKLLEAAEAILKPDGGLTPTDQALVLDALYQRGMTFWGADYVRYEGLDKTSQESPPGGFLGIYPLL